MKFRALIMAAVAAAGVASSAGAWAQNLNQGDGYVSWLYWKYLGRAPDGGGLSYWVGQYQSGTMTLESIHASFAGSAEAQNWNARGEITYYYRDLFGREPDSGGLNYWTNQFATGAMTLAQIRNEFAINAEARASINSVHVELLGRPATSAELDNYQNQMIWYGATLTDVRYGVYYGFGLQSTNVCEEIRPYDGSSSDASQILQACVAAVAAGQTLHVPRGKYMIGQTLWLDREVSIRTQFVADSAKKCPVGETHGCAELRKMSTVTPVNNIDSLISVQAHNVTLDHLVFNGNKANVSCSGLAGGVLSAARTNVQIRNSVVKNSACGGGLWLAGGTLQNTIYNNTFAYNGRHHDSVWADGVTVYSANGSSITNNEFIDNTDIDMVLGGCTSCTIQNNTFTHTADFYGGSFAALTFHAWPGGTLGDYTGAIVSNNVIDCRGSGVSGAHRCGFGLLLGSSAWYDTSPFGGEFRDNVIHGAQVGFAIDSHSGARIGNNYVTDSYVAPPQNYYWASCGPSQRPYYGQTYWPANVDVKRLDGTTYSQAELTATGFALVNHDDCIPMWWTVPF